MKYYRVLTNSCVVLLTNDPKNTNISLSAIDICIQVCNIASYTCIMPSFADLFRIRCRIIKEAWYF